MEKFTYIGPVVGKPRMTRSDKWKKRPCVERYWAFKDSITLQSNLANFKLSDGVKITVHIQIPKSRKKKLYVGQYHQQKPDADNIAKAIFDSLSKKDETIHTLQITKVWDTEDFIEIENLDIKI